MDERRKADSLRVLWLMAAALMLLPGSAWAGNSSGCVRAHVPHEFALPDGSVHPAGQLKICLNSKGSPVQGLHPTSAGGYERIFMSRHAKSEGTGTEPYILFSRIRSGQWFLVGYGVPSRDGYETFALYSFGPRSKGQRAERIAQAHESGDTIVVSAILNAGNGR